MNQLSNINFFKKFDTLESHKHATRLWQKMESVNAKV